jgi:polyisoprenoid-binding protein YceI
VRRWRTGPRRVARTSAVVGLLVAPFTAALAPADATGVFVIDPAKSQIRFFATSRFVDAEGNFRRFSGTLRFDPARVETASGEVVVDITSIDTRNGLRDDHLRSADFFDAERHPTATFVTTTIQPAAEGVLVSGQLTIRGVTRPVSVPVALTREADAIRIVGEVALNRREYGIRYQSILNPIRDPVRLRVDLVATRQ